MRIKRVEIIGFKSFCDRAVIQIGESVTGVVGPNGCGKSNIVDALRWCMGEQSAKHLRGKAMEDVIFAGSETRGPAPMAEVSLTFDDVGFSAETLEMARHSEQAETEAALEALAPDAVEGDEAPVVVEPLGTIEPLMPVEPLVSPDAVGASPRVNVWVDAEGNAIPSPADEVAKVLSDEPPAIDFARYTEVTITRRLYRDGLSQYFINKTPCRLRDITDFFLGTGVGTKAYSIIEQGRIGQIVSSRPQDRRAIIEEAAGITKFKAKKKAAEKKLDQTRQNLMRVSDIVSELDKRMGTLRRQAQKAERYRKYKSEMKDIELWKGSHRWLELAGEGSQIGLRLTEAGGELDEVRVTFQTKDAAVVAERAELAVEERRLSGVQEAVYELDNRIRLGESKIGFERREADELDARVGGARAEIEEVAIQRERGAVELAERRAELDALAIEVERETAEVDAREASAAAAKDDVASAQKLLDDARIELATRRTEIATADAQLDALARRRDEASRRLERVVSETDGLATRVKELEREGRKVDGALVTLRQTRLDLGNQTGGFETRRELLSDEVARGEAEVETLRTEVHRRTSRLASLKEIHERYEGFQRGTRAVMQHADRVGEGIHGVVADVVRAPETLEVAVEAALGDRLGGVLVSEAAVGLAAIGFLKQAGAGRSAFVPMTASASHVEHVARAAERAEREAVEVAPAPQHESIAVDSASDAEPTVAPYVRFDGEGGSSSWLSPAWREAAMADAVADAAAVADVAAVADAGAVAEVAAVGDAAAGAEVAAVGDADAGIEAAVEAEPAARHTSHGKIEFDDRTQLVAAVNAVGGHGVMGRMADLVSFQDGYAHVGRRLLGATVVVDDLDRAMKLHDAGVTDRLVTLDGDVVDEDGVVAGGSRDAQGAGVLAQKREIRDLDEIVGRLEHDLSEATARLVTAKTELKQVGKALDGLRSQVHEGEVAIMGHEKDETRVRHELERHRERLGQLGTEQLELESRLRAIEVDDASARDKKSHADQRIVTLERAQLDYLADVTRHRDRLDELVRALTEARIHAAQLGEKRAAAEASALRLAQTDAELQTRADRLHGEIDEAARRATDLRDGCDRLAAELADIRARRDAELVELDRGRTGYQERITALTDIELAVRELRQRADKLAGEVNHLELRANQVAMTRKVVEDQIEERYQTDVVAILADYHLRPMIGEAEDARLVELRELIDRMGTDINLTAIEEYAEVSQRFEFLSTQKIDLERAVDQLQRAIDKINKTSRRLFKDTFAAVNATFREVFPRLFRGGQAFLSLSAAKTTDAADGGLDGAPNAGETGRAASKDKDIDMLEAGVEIFAQPPGKKNATVDQLSGGEKALTAVALVFSIFLIKPSPFCVLDEVDAPLDEANVDRYNELVREMTDRSQFIVITHNKRTMEAADNLYGVTMQEPGVSKLVSVNLSKLAARGGASSPVAVGV